MNTEAKNQNVRPTKRRPMIPSRIADKLSTTHSTKFCRLPLPGRAFMSRVAIRATYDHDQRNPGHDHRVGDRQPKDSGNLARISREASLLRGGTHRGGGSALCERRQGTEAREGNGNQRRSVSGHRGVSFALGPGPRSH